MGTIDCCMEEHKTYIVAADFALIVGPTRLTTVVTRAGHKVNTPILHPVEPFLVVLGSGAESCLILRDPLVVLCLRDIRKYCSDRPCQQ